MKKSEAKVKARTKLAFAEYGDEEQKVDAIRVMTEFVLLTIDAMREDEEHIVIPTSLAMLLAFYLDTRVLPWCKEDDAA